MAIADSMGLILFLWIIGASALLVLFTRGIDFGQRRTTRDVVSDSAPTTPTVKPTVNRP